MAQTIQIPTSFEFRSVKIQWEEARANVVGWIDEQKEAAKAPHLIAKIDSKSGAGKNVGLPLSELPEKEKNECLKALGKRHSNDTVRDICSGLELRIFIHEGKAYIGESELRKHSDGADGWQLRAEFLSLKNDDEAILAFL
ncbi:MAG: hypothetical protein WCC95_22440, partial [Candidatus Sulfotelmatobacter sp.]